MKNNSYSIKSFTVLEIAITLAIMGIISVMTYYIYTSMTQQFYIYRKTKSIYFDYNLADSIIEEDVFNAKEIKTLNDSILIFKLEGDKTIKYEIKNNTIFRTHQGVKTALDIKIYTFDFSEVSNNIPKFTITYDVFEESLIAVYYKDLGLSRSINKRYNNGY